MQDVAAQAAAMAAQRDPRRNGMDNPFGDSDPLHPSLARLTGELPLTVLNLLYCLWSTGQALYFLARKYAMCTSLRTCSTPSI